MQQNEDGHVQDLQHKISPHSFASRDRLQSSFSTMSRYHPYKSTGDTQHRTYFPDPAAALGMLSPRYSVSACSALATPAAASHPYDSIIGTVYVPSRARTTQSSEKSPCGQVFDSRAAVLSRAKQVLCDTQVCLDQVVR